MKTIKAELHAVTVPDNRRRKSGPVSAIAESMKRVGLINPITLTKDLVLISGLHRFEAAQSLGWEHIDARIIDADARLVEIDENLCRNELTALERAEHRSERKRLYEAMYPEVKHGGDRRSVSSGHGGHLNYAEVTATEEGVTARTIRRSVAIAENIPEDVRDEIRDLPIADNQKELARLSKLDEDTQRRVVEKIRGGKSPNVRSAKNAIVADAIESEPAPMPSGPFRVIVADPPWTYDKRKDDATHRAGLPYPSMAVEEICGLPVAELACDDAVLWLWTTNAHMREAFTVVDAWGFVPRTILTWAKDRMGTGDWLRGKTEHCLMAIRGRPTVRLTNQTTLLHGPLREHSRKPEEFYALVADLCPGSKVEIFAREPREGWESWGAESEKWP